MVPLTAFKRENGGRKVGPTSEAQMKWVNLNLLKSGENLFGLIFAILAALSLVEKG